MKTVALLYVLMSLFALPATAQLCPGGGVDFNSAVAFDPSWIYGCNTGTSCNGGVAFDNRASCEPTTAMDACAPPPSCGSVAHNGSDIWFKFLPSGTTATISCFQNTSLIIGVQAFSGGPTCGSLTEIGCALSGGPSSGVQLHLSGLVPGTLYYYRIFGSATPPSQRTGLYCFCGSTGLGGIVLASALAGFNAQAAGSTIALSWTTPLANTKQRFDIERSMDGSSFAAIASLPETGSAGLPQPYRFTDAAPLQGINYYRLKHILEDGHYDYSAVVSAKAGPAPGFTLFFNAGRQELQVNSMMASPAVLYDAAGRPVLLLQLQAGSNSIPVHRLVKGVYFMRALKTGVTQKCYIGGQ